MLAGLNNDREFIDSFDLFTHMDRHINIAQACLLVKALVVADMSRLIILGRPPFRQVCFHSIVMGIFSNVFQGPQGRY